ncbi:hypothetical protein GIY56_09455 [Paracoccus sp. YIM 132242]|uniref:Uncharacterized protein n=1 Tax=Paracoccus lichenicola TaxID=2665644 RepID=A0A6L6HMV6_9RHOB|nr:hypothetical protein [Paracoccus lichenicola]MTE00514.1 hypothetical protein [Paracoccus lichenicola]
MDNTITGAIIGALGAVAVGMFTVGYQIWQRRIDEKLRETELVMRQKMSIISDLVAYRFAITGGTKNTPQDVSNFNAALSRIPVEFIDHPTCVELYRKIGDNFTAGRFYELINELVKAADPKRKNFDLSTIEGVPTATPLPLQVVISGLVATTVPIQGDTSHPSA